MPVVGAVLLLSNEVRHRAEVVELLAADSRVSLGEPEGDRLPVAVATDSLAEDEGYWRDLLAQPGVMHAEIVFAALEDAGASAQERQS